MATSRRRTDLRQRIEDLEHERDDAKEVAEQRRGEVADGAGKQSELQRRLRKAEEEGEKLRSKVGRQREQIKSLERLLGEERARRGRDQAQQPRRLVRQAVIKDMAAFSSRQFGINLERLTRGAQAVYTAQGSAKFIDFKISFERNETAHSVVALEYGHCLQQHKAGTLSTLNAITVDFAIDAFFVIFGCPYNAPDSQLRQAGSATDGERIREGSRSGSNANELSLVSALCSLILYNGISNCRAGSTFTVEGCSRSSIKPQTPDLLTRLTRLLRDAAIEQHLAKEEIELAFARQRESKAVMQLNGLRSVVKDLVKDARQAEQGDIGAVGGEGVVRGQGVPAWQQLEVLKPVQLEKVEQKLREAKTQPRLVSNLTLREVWL